MSDETDASLCKLASFLYLEMKGGGGARRIESLVFGCQVPAAPDPVTAYFMAYLHDRALPFIR